MDKILLMLQLQNQLNDATNGEDWPKGVTKNGKTINWKRCIYMECAEMIDSFFAEGYRLRYSGGMVPDLHQILLKGGGLFAYPAAGDKPKGKLRKLFEVFPFAYVYNKAGGLAIDGKNDLLELGIEHIHDTSPCFFGSDYEIKRVLETYEKVEK